MFYPSYKEKFAALLAEIDSLKLPVVVIGHTRPDGDCIGSQVAFCRILRALGHDAVCVNADAVPRRTAYALAGTPFFGRQDLPEKNYAAVYVDCGDIDRAGEKLPLQFPNPVGEIDHHLGNPNFAKHCIVDSSSAAACELIAGLALDAGLPIDAATAKALYLGIATDTGQFRFNSTSRRTFEIAAQLVALGANATEAAHQLYECEPLGKSRLLQRFLASFQFACDNRVCVGTLSRGIYEETGTTAEDTEGIVDYTRYTEGVDIGVLIEEREGSIKASLRAKFPDFRVDLIAAKFGGGGHACAAGINRKNVTLEVFRAELLAAIAESLDKVPRG